ncbi:MULTISPECIES: GNAT family N-acetyltransferase [Carnobacterium]|uniref:GNAT family N-acetyltransferase n=1 Tax=Carnobacterium TaxID=2747 RepID=UPI0028901B17|nr:MULTISPECIES: GNAT family N-acetyltransferase [Carnobacterium]MDT1940820.1 GNAT family N-acetyltransferase [Carnobacterium divergens]MDT1943259.1 GNAT family N-acetyltransferase [Carnobacterium divergens]MDT1949065.1 GNAT family N-acetyltransferase [Carnobacterium divergens]MDT1951549.1 GNAT family N-acetyltransferase [Carnobacterium divergens]MDT1956724.1 GNAT family N-acetyltransferase [Carnobacterium divergens]
METELCHLQQLTDSHIQAIQTLESAQQKKNLSYKLDPKAFEKNSTHYQHFLYFEKTELKGYLSASTFDGVEIEASILTNNNQEIATILINALVNYAKEQGIKRILFISDRKDPIIPALIKKYAGAFSFTEYRLNFDPANFNQVDYSPLVLHSASQEDRKLLYRLDHEGFTPQDKLIYDQKKIEALEIEGNYIAYLDNEIVGKIKLDHFQGIIGIYGVVITSEWQGQGLGRALLNQGIQLAIDQPFQKLYLEVDSQNARALKLYLSAGFYQEAIFDYYELDL